VGKPGGERLIIQDMSWEMVGFLGGGWGLEALRMASMPGPGSAIKRSYNAKVRNETERVLAVNKGELSLPVAVLSSPSKLCHVIKLH